MPPPPRSLAVRVPGSTSNLGPGFDCLGLALALHLDVRVRALVGPDGLSVEAPPGWPPPERDLFLAAFRLAAERLGGGPTKLAVEIATEIPIGRGLGSSGAAVAAGLLLGRAFAPRPAGERELVAWGIELEGHPDNVTASLLGGCTLCLPGDAEREPLYVRPAVHPDLRFVLAWSDAALSTADARAVLPATVAFSDAVENARRLPLLLEGLRTGDERMLAEGSRDRLHERHRLPLIPGGAEALRAARAAGAPLACVSGAGAGLVAATPPACAEHVAAAMRAALERADGGVVVRVVAAAPTPEPPAP